MKKLFDAYGRPFDDFDALRMRYNLAPLVKDSSYVVLAEDGTPMLGFLSAKGGDTLTFTAKGWVAKDSHEGV